MKGEVKHQNVLLINRKSMLLYDVCSNGDVDQVKRLLKTANLKEINRSESDGSTPLHIACRKGYEEIIRLLLEHGAERRRENNKQITPIDETSNPIIKQLFQRSNVQSKERFVTEKPSIDWTYAASTVAYTNRLGHFRSYPLDFVLDKFEVTEELEHCQGKHLIDYFCTRAKETNDSSYLLKLYTAETGFYKLLNRTMATNEAFLRTADMVMPWALYFSGVLYRNPQLDPYRYQGQVYRGMRIRETDLQNYQNGAIVVNKGFLSTSKQRVIAEIFSGWNDVDPADKETFPVICRCQIHNQQSSLDLTLISEFPDEEEVLILPSTVFSVVNIKFYKEENRNKYEIELEEEIDPYENEPVVPLPAYPRHWNRHNDE